ncbi:MAG TPA: BMP family ABC transporter substrate-binding protein [Desulfurococcales archaeon]|nr:BMP family ABC transporter substrate-binding protein [Desulfurococcales archaeon]
MIAQARLGLLIAVLIIGLVVGASSGYFLAPKVTEKITETVEVTRTVTTTVTTGVATTPPKVTTVTVTVVKTETVTVTASPTPVKPVKAAIVIRKRGDLGFNDMGWLGGQMAVAKLGAKVDYFYYEVVPMAQYLKFLDDICRRGYDIIVVVNFMMAEQVAELSKKYPEIKFAILDAIVEDRPNVLSILFKENEGSALIGALAALLTKTNKVGIVLGMDIPPLWKFEIGFKWGVHYVMNMTGKEIKIFWQYVGTFGDPAKGKEAAILMLQQGADVIYHAAGETGLGVLDAVYEYAKKTGKEVYAIGVDAPQEWVHPGYIIASMVKHVEVAVYKAIESVALGTFKGEIWHLGLKEGGVDISLPEDIKKMIDIAVELNLMSKEEADKTYKTILEMREKVLKGIWDKIVELRSKIIKGEIKVPYPTAETIKELREKYK